MKLRINKKLTTARVMILGLMLLNACSSVQKNDDDLDDASLGQDASETTAKSDTDVVPADAPAADKNSAPSDTAPVLDLAGTADATTAPANATPTAETAPIAPVTDTSTSPVTSADTTTPSAAELANAPIANADAPPPIINDTTTMTTPPPAAPAETATEAAVTAVVTENNPAPQQDAVTTPGSYTVKPGDTLMKISYEQLGDVYRWREIYEANKDQIQDYNQVPPGTVLKISESGRNPSSVTEHNGEQYLIQSGDTLSLIAKSVYGDFQKWKAIWENNKQLIHDPNKIYAGFFLYYLPANKLSQNKSIKQPATSSEGT